MATDVKEIEKEIKRNIFWLNISASLEISYGSSL